MTDGRTAKTKDPVAEVRERLYGETGLQATNFGITLGSSRDVTPAQIASEVNKALRQLENGDYEIVDDFDD
jgi:hypothetical protein